MSPPTAHPFRLRLIAIVLLINLAVAGLTVLWLLQNRQQHEEKAVITARNLARVLEENIVGTINKIDISLLAVADEVERQLAADGIDADALNAVIARAHARQVDIDGMRVSDAAGRLLYGDGITAATRAAITDRDYFIRLRDDPGAELVFSEPVLGRISHKPVVILARRIRLPDGGFGGVVLASIALDSFSRAFHALDVGRRGAICLRDTALRVIARIPLPAKDGHTGAEPDLRRRITAEPAGGLFTATSPFDQVERVSAYRRVAAFPYYVIVGLSTEDNLTAWRSEAARSAALLTGFLLITLASTRFIFRAWTRQMSAVDALLRQDAELRSERNFNRQLIKTAQAIILVLDPRGAIVYINRFMEELTGYTLEEVKGADWFDTFLPPEDREPIRALFARAIGNCRTRGYVNPIVARNGRRIFVEWYDDTLADGNDGLTGLLAIGLDVTERLAGEEALCRRTQEIKEAQRLAHIGSWTWLVDPDVVYWSEELYRIFGFDPNGPAPQYACYLERFEPESRERLAQANRHALHTGEPYELDLRFVGPDGAARWITARGEAKRDAAGAIVGLLGTAQDITERRQATQNLHHLNRLYTVLSKTNEMIVRVRNRTELFTESCRIPVEEGGFLMAWIGLVDPHSQRVVPTVRWGRDDGYLDTVRIMAASDEERGRGPTGTAVREGVSVICADIAADPRMRPWREEALRRGYRSSAAFPIRENGQVIGAYTLYAAEPDFFAHDIVQLVEDLSADISFAVDYINHLDYRHQAERQLRSLNESLEQRVAERTRQLEATNKELESFSYSVSHDLRAPLRSIDGFSRILLTRHADALDETGRNYLDRIARAAKRMGELIDDLLQLSRLGRSELRKTSVDLSEAVHTIAEALQAAAPTRAVQWVIEDGVRVEADERLMRSLLENLLGNAWKFTAHTAAARIEFGTLTRDGERVLFVRDNGAGFDMRYANKLFTAFQRLHRADEFEGTGIGLATVQRIVNRHGGRIWAEGEVGRGAVFYVVV